MRGIGVIVVACSTSSGTGRPVVSSIKLCLVEHQ